ncbi:hypothetical protein GE21DRAFT_9393 [Neurospora crassa]|uniref:Indole-diterpene biosynthesis protein PaxU n=1 Tax=Neurospora crassa (strain ATCC 24698 / 74-OR23-1A / CBS 708.71 / DSM 1257 / FGSC 987) TaxID=367110 RepID=Q7S2C5_NEUCR|nr:hypothetical protein NCU05953 [Neurospora crassa OR74A]EAA29561.1 hypothetical protein NCU05953 [Neurospora crassa OR74A]KHE87520.1 hypothetical protein GE21DRAFT_9393 [Neurospora crassa]|eukprot:XP_958797.1 hypothetical protein NCU05953 [Neurospora crassa OR74A]
MPGSKTKTPPISPRPKSNHAHGPTPLSEFQNLGKGILFFDPAAAATSPPNHDGNHNHDPQLIVLCTWLGGATPRRIAKYTSGYRRLFPVSPILVIQTVIADFTVRSEQAIRRNLAPARDVIRHVLLTRFRPTTESPRAGGVHSAPENENHRTGTGRTGILLHIFSNGGCHLSLQLAHTYLSSFGHDSLPVSLQILDSCPGTFSIAQTYGAAVHSVPAHHPWAVQSLERWGLWGAVVLVAGIQNGLPRAIGEKVVRRKLLGGVGVDFEGMRRGVLDDGLFGGGGQRDGKKERMGRLYLYSKADEVVGWRDVERHVWLARKLVVKKKKKGIENGLVRAERFEKASHCALVMEDEERYWRAVRESWEGQMERRRMRRESREEEECEPGKVVLGATDERGGEGGVGEEPGTRSGVEEGVESRAAEVSRTRGRTSKL